MGNGILPRAVFTTLHGGATVEGVAKLVFLGMRVDDFGY